MDKKLLTKLIKTYTASEISKQLKLPYSTVIYYCRKFNLKPIGIQNQGYYINFNIIKNKTWQKNYSYLFGLYLGDGCLNSRKNIKYHNYDIRIYQDSKYPILIQACANAMQKVIGRKPSVVKRKQSNCYVISAAAKNLINIFPQHGPGKKSDRRIKIKNWQKNIIKLYPKQFIKGLIDSDGCRYLDNNYIRYSFINKSFDIIKIFEYYIKLCGVSSIYIRQRKDGIYVALVHKKHDVQLLESFIGIKK